MDHQKQRLRNLYRWRYQKAQEIDRAPFLILDDRLMMTLAQAEIDPTDSGTVPDKSQCGAFCRYVNELIPIPAGPAAGLNKTGCPVFNYPLPP